ncbi:MAG: glutamate formimidoyltransferase [Planctomycetota bacterium]
MLLEAVPNFSEGRRPEVVAAIGRAAARVEELALLDSSLDGDHNRAVLTMAGPPEAIVEGLLAAAGVARSWIDLGRHEGVHPRLGAMDVCPVVPLRDATMADAVATARRVADLLASEVGLPSLLYGEACELEAHRELPDLRRGGLAGLRARLAAGDRLDRGGPLPHPTAGVCCVGAREVLIAFNVVLDGDDLGAARRIARAVRGRDGGLPAVRALGLRLPRRGVVQVSLNLLDWRRTGLRAAFAAVEAAAAREGVGVAGSELVGLAPAAALDEATAAAVRLEGGAAGRTIEERLRASGL